MLRWKTPNLSFVHAARPYHGPPARRQLPKYSKRSYSIIQTCSDGLLDLAIALPLPPSVPPYSTTIILITVFSRLALLPVSLWAKKRQHRAEEIVMPHLEQLKPVLYKSVLKEMQKSRVSGSATELKTAHAKRVKQLLTTRRNQLFDEYRCQPLPTVLVPILSQLPIFVLISTVLARLSQNPTPFESESFLTLTSLAHTDPTNALPIVLGIITMANVESSRWAMTTEEKQRELKVEEWSTQKRARGETVLQPKKHIQSGLRILSVGRIVVGSLVPGSVVLYWVSSAAFGLLQTWAFDWWDMKRKRRLLRNSRAA